MRGSFLIHNAKIASIPGQPLGWVWVCNNLIMDTGLGEPAEIAVDERIDADGALLFPGLIDTHVHFREPGLEHKGDIYTESKQAVLGGITSYIEMPNTVPPTTTAAAFFEKHRIAAERSYANYAFMPAASDDIMQTLADIPPHLLPSIKMFMGSTTGAMGMPSQPVLNQMLSYCHSYHIPVVVHAEDNEIINANTQAAIARYGSKEAVPIDEHYNIRSAEACLSATKQALELVKLFNFPLHIAHISTPAEIREVNIFNAQRGWPQVTTETTPMYMDCYIARQWTRKPASCKINPAIKGFHFKIQNAVLRNEIDTIATDHAPHLWEEKIGGALTAASGAPSVRYALETMLEYLPPHVIAEKMAAAPARIFGIQGRGHIKPGYAADLTLVRPCKPYSIDIHDSHNYYYKCGWTPFEGFIVNHRVEKVWVNGFLAAEDGRATIGHGAEPLTFKHQKCTT